MAQEWASHRFAGAARFSASSVPERSGLTGADWPAEARGTNGIDAPRHAASQSRQIPLLSPPLSAPLPSSSKQKNALFLLGPFVSHRGGLSAPGRNGKCTVRWADGLAYLRYVRGRAGVRVRFLVAPLPLGQG